MALIVVNKINNKLIFFSLKNSFLTPTMRCPVCNALVQPHFHYACSVTYRFKQVLIQSFLRISIAFHISWINVKTVKTLFNFLINCYGTYLKGTNFRGYKFSRNKFSRLDGSKWANFAELIFAVERFSRNSGNLFSR